VSKAWVFSRWARTIRVNDTSHLGYCPFEVVVDHDVIGDAVTEFFL
jgi:hypothetical protein